MKRLFALLLCSAMLLGSFSAVRAETTTSTSVSDSGDTETEEATPAPTSDPITEEATAAPAEGNTESYTGEADPEDSTEEITMGTGSVNTDIGAAGGTGFYGSKFPDCRGHWAEEMIIECTDKKYLDGYEDGSFRPDAPVTASEFSKIFSAWRGSFYQLTSGYWATPYIRKMLDDKIFFDGDYKDYDVPMRREQVAKAVISSIKNEKYPAELTPYEALIPDIDETDESLREYVTKAYIAGIITGYEDGSAAPKRNVTRAELLYILDRTADTEAREVPREVAELMASLSGTDLYKTVTLYADTAEIEGGMLNKFGSGEDAYIENFRLEQKITYNFKASLAGKYKMTMYYSANVNSGGGTVAFDLNGAKFSHEFAQTGGWAMYVYEDIGTVDLKEGSNTLILTDEKIPNTYLINIKTITFEKVD